MWAVCGLMVLAVPLACGDDSAVRAPIASSADANASADDSGRSPSVGAPDSEAAADNDGNAEADVAVTAADGSDSMRASDAGTDGSDAMRASDAATDGSDATRADDGATLPDAIADSMHVDASDGSPSEAGGAPGDDPCTSADPGNFDPAHASQYVLGTTFNGCIRSYSDTDYIAFTTPPNPAGGYIVASFTAPGLYQSALTVDSYLYLASNTMIAYYVFEMSAAHPGDNLTYWFAAAPSTAYVLRVVDLFRGVSFASFTFTATFIPVVDPTKPNSSEGTATMVTLGTPVQAYEFHGYTNSDNFSDIGWQSYYEVNLAAKPTTVQITNVPAELIMDAYVYGNYSAGEASILGYGSGGANGAPFTLTTDQSFNAGPHYVFVEALFNPHAYGMGSTPPSYVLHPYTLVVTQ